MVGCDHHGLRTPTGTGGSGAGGVKGTGGSTSIGGAPGTGGARGSGGTTEASTQPDAALQLDGPTENQDTNQPSEPAPRLDTSQRDDVAADAAPSAEPDGGVDSGPGALLTVSPSDATFWVPSEAEEGPMVFTVSNAGSASSGTFAVTLTGADVDRFEITSDSCDRPLPPGESCQVAVAFKHTYGSYYASLEIVADGFPGGKVSVWLTGNEG
jgi:hypothetical protein